METLPVAPAVVPDLTPFCSSFHHAVEIIGRRWSGAIIRSMLSGRRRFTEIQTTIPGLSDRLLSERLKELEHGGIVERVVVPDHPVRIEYHLTPKGRDLAGVVYAVSEWANRWTPAADDAAACAPITRPSL